MTALSRLFRTTSFRLAAAFILVFALNGFFVIGYIAYNTRVLITSQHVEMIDAEIAGLAEQYRVGGLRRLVGVIDHRSRRPGASLYLVTDPTGRNIAGNVGALPPGLLDQPGTRQTAYERLDAPTDKPDELRQHAVVRVFVLPGGFRMLVGRDIAEREQFRDIIAGAFRWSVLMTVLLGVAAWYFVSSRVLRRIDAVAEESRHIMVGDLAGRIGLAGTGDEFDRLAESLNAMLDRIEQLLRGLTEVSDNIAHDLKTPLTRLRNRVEGALRNAPSEEGYRAALEATIAESDELIRTFNALLMIARVEAGSPDGAMTDLDIGTMLADVAELYEPVAEQAGVEFVVAAPAGIVVRLNRELVGQALANLIDNAVKYAAETGDDRKPRVELAACADGGRILLTVSDNGPGIPEADRKRVLDRFVRLEQSRTKPGSGLGLSLVAAVAHSHGGEIRLEDNAPGLRVVLDLPASGGGS